MGKYSRSPSLLHMLLSKLTLLQVGDEIFKTSNLESFKFLFPEGKRETRNRPHWNTLGAFQKQSSTWIITWNEVSDVGRRNLWFWKTQVLSAASSAAGSRDSLTLFSSQNNQLRWEVGKSRVAAPRWQWPIHPVPQMSSPIILYWLSPTWAEPQHSGICQRPQILRIVSTQVSQPGSQMWDSWEQWCVGGAAISAYASIITMGKKRSELCGVSVR